MKCTGGYPESPPPSTTCQLTPMRNRAGSNTPDPLLPLRMLFSSVHSGVVVMKQTPPWEGGVVFQALKQWFSCVYFSTVTIQVLS